MDKKIILSIDITKEKPEIAILNTSFHVLSEYYIDSPYQLSEKLLQSIDTALEENGYDLKNIKAVYVNPGPGSYTGLRIALATANCLAFSLNIPVIKEKSDQIPDKFEKIALPIYYQSPVITKRKPRL